MALSVSGLYSPSLEKSNSEFLGSNSTTPSPTSYKSPAELASLVHPNLSETNERQTAAVVSNDYPFHQRSPPPSELKEELTRGRRRGQSASARPTLRLHIANPTEPLDNQLNDAQEKAMKSTIQMLQAKAQTAQTLYPRSVVAANSDIHNRRRGETVSDFSRTIHPGSSAPGSGNSLITGHMLTNTGSEPAPATVFHSGQVDTRTASSSLIRITTANLNFSAAAVAPTPNSSSPNSTPSSSGSAQNITTKRPYRASPLIGPQAMMSATSGTNSSVSTAPTAIFAEDHYSSASSTSASTVSTPATQESASEFTSRTLSGANVGVSGTRRPLPVPPPSSTIGSTMLSVAPSKAPLSPPIPPPLHPLHIPTRSLTPSATLSHGSKPLQHGFGHERSSSGDLDLKTNTNDRIAAELAYRMEKRRGKQPMRGETAPNSPTVGIRVREEDEIPYELRSEKWRGKQKMQNNIQDTTSFPQQFISPNDDNVTDLISPPLRPPNEAKIFNTHEVGLPPSLSGTLTNQPSRASIASSHSSTRSSGNERGVSKWKGKGKQVLRTLSISSISSLEKDAGGKLSKYAQSSGRGMEVRKSGDFSSFNANDTFQADSPASSFSASPVVPPPLSMPTPVPSPASINLTSHPSALIPGGYSNPRVNSPRLMGNIGFDSRSTSPRAVAWAPTPPLPMYVEPPLPLNIRKIASPGTSPTIPLLPPTLPPKDYNYKQQQPILQSNAQDQAPMHIHPFDNDDSDDEGNRLFKDVEAVYVSPTTYSARTEATDRPVDMGWGYAEPGYEDDERVYVDDGYDDPNNPGLVDALDREFGFGVSASGQLVNGGGVVQSSSNIAQGGVTHGGFSSSRISIAKERSPSPMRYARRRRDSLLEDDYDSPESNGVQSPIEFASIPSPGSSQAQSRSLSPAVLEGFVYVENNASPLASTATQILNSLDSRRPLSPPSSSPPALPRSDVDTRGRQPTRKQNYFDPAQMLGDELEMSFSKNPSPTRYHPTKGVYQVGALAVLAEDKVYVRGKWRMRSPSPGLSPVSPTGTNSVAINKAALVSGQGGGLRRYASEESLLSAVMPSEKDNHIAGNFNGFAPLRSSGFEEFNLAAPNPGFASKRFVDRIPTPDSDSASFNPNASKKSLSSQDHGNGGGSSSGRHTPILRGPGSKPEHADDFGFGTGWKTALEHSRPARKSRGPLERDSDKDSIGRGREPGGQGHTSGRRPAKLEKKRSLKRGLSLPRASGGSDNVGGGIEGDMKRSGTSVAHQRHLQPSEHISYDLWVERGLDQTSAAVKGKKTIPPSKI
ncbi:uncharacterized protein C8R40DRAFT_1067256 [Lentinula edodes]|uniref:uncharacterized protein n=1 Tax=Lentinula edodes TaxID=5353 RepID=UPI001E8E8362|nr:uncharacterized protein C8R40DRAFT_1067256 [Lentinula edodes]KAH7878223.1 hypothetical protein C8R40DRAFT_1067256 [Lentinula edodes]